MKSNKYLHSYLIFMGIFCTFHHDTLASQETETTLQEPTTTEDITPEKKSETICPHTQTPLEQLTATQLEELLDCKQQQKATLEQTVETIESVLEAKTSGKKSSKAKKEKARCPYYNMPLKKLKGPQLEEVYTYTKTHPMDPAFMIDLLTRLIALSDNHAGVKQYKLQLADTHYNVHHIEKAAACYEDFAVLYPGSDENEYVLYKAVACMFELSLEADRDQTNTKKTIALVKEFLKHAKNTELINEAKNIMQTCYDRLYDHEVYVFNFYVKKKNFTAAELRLAYIKKSFQETIVNLQAHVEELEKKLHEAKNHQKKPFWGLLSSYETPKDDGPVDTTKNKAAKFLA